MAGPTSIFRPRCFISLKWSSAHFISKHYPLKPLKFTKLAYMVHLSGYNCFRYLPIQFENAVCSSGPYVWFKSRQTPQSLFGALDLIKFLPEPFMQWMAQSILSDMMLLWVSCWINFGSFLWHCHKLLQVAPHLSERKRAMLHGLHFWDSLGMSMTNQNWWQNLCTSIAFFIYCSGEQCFTVHIMW